MIPEYLFEFPNMNDAFPFYMKKKRYTRVPAHRHDFIELAYVLGGRGTEWINGKPHPMKPGTVVLLLPYQVHRIEADPGEPLHMVVCNFDMQAVMALRDFGRGLASLMFPEDEAPAYAQCDAQAADELGALLDSMLAEYEQRKPWRTVMLKSRLLQALALFDRLRRAGMPGPGGDGRAPDMPAGDSPGWRLVEYVYQHYMEPLSLAELGRRFRLHPAHISELFKRQLGIGFARFMRELRLRHACSLLITTDMAVIDIAHESGFGSFQSFFRVFRHSKGTTPLAYRKSRSRADQS